MGRRRRWCEARRPPPVSVVLRCRRARPRRALDPGLSLLRLGCRASRARSIRTGSSRALGVESPSRRSSQPSLGASGRTEPSTRHLKSANEGLLSRTLVLLLARGLLLVPVQVQLDPAALSAADQGVGRRLATMTSVSGPSTMTTILLCRSLTPRLAPSKSPMVRSISSASTRNVRLTRRATCTIAFAALAPVSSWCARSLVQAYDSF